MNLIMSDFLKDAIIIIILTIIIATLLAVAVGEVVEAYFFDTVSTIIGDNGEYDFALIVDSDLKEEALVEAEKIIEEHFPDSKIFPSLEVAGKSNYFLQLAPEHFTAENLAQADSYFREVPGFNSLSLLAEPRITVNGLTNRGAVILKEEVDDLSEVRFSFVKGSRLELILTDFRYTNQIEAQIEELLSQYKLLTISSNQIEELEYNTQLLEEEVLINYPQIEELTATDGELEKLAKNLSMLTELVEGYSFAGDTDMITDVLDDLTAFMSRLDYQSGLFESINKAENILEQLEKGAQISQDNLEQLKSVTSQTDRFLNGLIVSLERLDFLSDLEIMLTTFGFADSRLTEYIEEFNLFSKRLIAWQNQVREINSVLVEIEDLSSFELDGFEAELFRLKELFFYLDSWNFEKELENLVYIEEVLLKLNDEEIVSAFQQLERYTSSYTNSDGELLFLLPETITTEEFITDFKTAYGLESDEISYYSSNWGLIAPNLRGEIHRILREVKVLMVVIAVMIITAIALIFDQSLVVNFLKLIALEEKNKFYLPLIYSLFSGAVIFSISIYLTGIDLYYISNYLIPLPGMILGLLIYKKSADLNEIKINDFRAGLAFGFSYCEILRQIVIPAGKPGLLYLVNKRRTYF